MTREAHDYIIAYDIQDQKRLRRANKTLKRYAVPIQLSVFFLHGTEESFRKAVDAARKVVDARHDELRAYVLPAYGEHFRLGSPIFGEGIHWSGLPADL